MPTDMHTKVPNPSHYALRRLRGVEPSNCVATITKTWKTKPALFHRFSKLLSHPPLAHELLLVVSTLRSALTAYEAHCR